MCICTLWLLQYLLLIQKIIVKATSNRIDHLATNMLRRYVPSMKTTETINALQAAQALLDVSSR